MNLRKMLRKWTCQYCDYEMKDIDGEKKKRRWTMIFMIFMLYHVGIWMQQSIWYV